MELVYKFKYHEKSETLDELCKVSNNLYNQALYKVLMHLKEKNKWLRYNELDRIMKVEKNLEDNTNYKLLKAQTAQQILRQLDKDWVSYFRGIKAYKKDKTGFSGMPKRPNFKEKNDRFLLKYTLDYKNDIIKVKTFLYLSDINGNNKSNCNKNSFS